MTAPALPEFSIDPATPADIPQLAEFNRQMAEDEAHPYPLELDALRERMARWVAGEYQVLMFRRGSRLAGYAAWRVEEHGAYLRHFFICRDQRREGLGRVIAMRLHRDVLPKDRPLLIDVAVWNAPAIAFWHGLGFKDFALMMELKAGAALT